MRDLLIHVYCPGGGRFNNGLCVAPWGDEGVEVFKHITGGHERVSLEDWQKKYLKIAEFHFLRIVPIEEVEDAQLHEHCKRRGLPFIPKPFDPCRCSLCDEACSCPCHNELSPMEGQNV